MADVDRYFDATGKNKGDRQDAFVIIKNLTTKIYENIYSVSSLEQALLVRGKLRMINKIFKQAAPCQTENVTATATFSEEQFSAEANAIQRVLTTNCTPQDIPKAYILGGQPGAGKTRIITIINALLQRNAVIISGDDFRNRHPNYCGLRETYGDKYVDKTATFSGKITEYMIEICSAQKLNLIIEGTLRTAEVPQQTEQLLKAKGYETELAVMAVNPKLSYLGTLTRYEKMLEIGTVARRTAKEHHDKVIVGMVANIKAISNSQQFDNITLYNRKGACLYNQRTNPEIDCQKILNQEHNRALLEEEIADCKEQLKTVLKNMRRRNDSRFCEVECFSNELA